MLYFAYASNLSKEYMMSRCPEAMAIKRVVLKDHKLTFNQLADIIHVDGEKTFGALYLISKQELDGLDKLEGYPDLYDRMEVEVEDDNGNKYNAIAYTMVEKDLEMPPEHYYNLLLKGYEDWELPLEYLNKAVNIQQGDIEND